MGDELRMIGTAGWFSLGGKPCLLWRGSDGLWYVGEELRGYPTQAEVISTYKLAPTEPNVQLPATSPQQEPTNDS